MAIDQRTFPVKPRNSVTKMESVRTNGVGSMGPTATWGLRSSYIWRNTYTAWPGNSGEIKGSERHHAATPPEIALTKLSGVWTGPDHAIADPKGSLGSHHDIRRASIEFGRAATSRQVIGGRIGSRASSI
jgi:hypothetical protein